MEDLKKELIKEHKRLLKRLEKTKDYLLESLTRGDDEDIRKTRLQAFAMELYSAALEARIDAISTTQRLKKKGGEVKC